MEEEEERAEVLEMVDTLLSPCTGQPSPGVPGLAGVSG